MELEPKFVLVVLIVALAVVAIFVPGSRRGGDLRRTCRTCGAAHPAFARFCRRCGHKL